MLIGTGSEVHVCLAAADLPGLRRRPGRGWSPSRRWDLFAAQPEGYRTEVLPDGVPRLAVEAATSFGWDRYADASVSIDTFGASAPGVVALEEFGFTAEQCRHAGHHAARPVAGGVSDGPAGRASVRSRSGRALRRSAKGRP